MNDKLKAHLFVCTSCSYRKHDGTDSDPEEAYLLRKNLKQRAKEHFSNKEVRVSSVKCLGECDRGIAAVLYPKGEWLLSLTPQDENEIFKKLSDEVGLLK